MRRIEITLSSLLALAVTGEAAAFSPSTSHWDPTHIPIGYKIKLNSIPASLGAAAGQAAVEAGFTTWAGPACTRWRATDLGNSTLSQSVEGDHESTISWLSGSWPSALGDVNQVIGITTPVWQQGGYVFDADIQFNNVGFQWSTNGQGGTVDAASIATHEEGHFLGLDHTQVRGAIMYPVYSSGLVRTLSNDDQSGVCAVYPSGSAPTDGGTTSDPCSPSSSSCAACAPMNGCGWCGASSQCLSGTSSGPSQTSCGSGWIRDPNACGGSMTDPCAAASSCGTCTPTNGCGWCGSDNACESGTQTGPTSGACASNWAWFQNDCTGTAGGNRQFGEACTGPNDCASGGLCVTSGGNAFCSRACGDDCTCPRGYGCVAIPNAGLSVCAPGTNSCSMGNPDASVARDAGSFAPDAMSSQGGVDAMMSLPGIDAASTIGGDAEAITTEDGAASAIDSGTHTTHPATGGTGATRLGGCASVAGDPSFGALISIVVALAWRRRRHVRSIFDASRSA